MTTPEFTGGALDNSIKPLRSLFAWGMLAYAAVELFFTFLDWITPSTGSSFTARSYSADFADLFTIVLPIVAVLIATHISPVLAASRLIATVALLEYAVVLVFGALTFLIGLGYTFTGVNTARETVGAFSHIVFGLLGLALAALAGYGVLRVFTALGGRLPTR